MNKFVLIAVLVLAIAIVGCAPAPTATPPPPPPATAVPAAPTTAAPVAPTAATAGIKVLRICLTSGPDVVDPQKSSFVGEIGLMQMMYEGLTRIDAKGNVVPGAAEKWESKDGGKKLVFTIRSGLKRVDGTAMTAKDFEYALRREVDPRVVGKQYTSIVYDIKGAAKLDETDPKKVASADIDKMLANDYGVKALDDKTLEVEFVNPVGFWNYVSSMWVTFPTDKAKADKDQDNWWTKPEGHNGNGPFKVTKIEEGKRWVFEPNANWRGDKAKFNRVEVLYITDSAQQFEAYKKGECDVIGVAPEDFGTVKADATLSKEWLHGPAAWTTYVGFNNTTKPSTDKQVRIAFSQIFDRKHWTTDILKGQAEPYRSWIPPGVPGFDATAVVADTNPKEAFNTLVKAGYGTADGKKIDCAKLGEIKLTYSATARNHVRFQAMAGYFVAALNCPVILDPVDATVLTALLKELKTTPQLFTAGWIEDYHHPQNWLSVYWVCAGFGKRTGYCNKDFDALIAKADAELDFNKAVDLYKQAQKIVINDIPAAFAYYNTYDYLVKPYLIGLKDNFASSDAWVPGFFQGTPWTFDVDLTKVGPSYPKQ
ncbi:MAG: peptide ABC transporter substrate-binding protein [Chloroflexi bacterium]|nr:peptide ABC transporter substrate-binding protein [Chloroflexota bacterium]